MVDTPRLVLDAALACFVEDGYERTTIAAIRARSGVSNGALFHHFQSKEAIADALYVEAIRSFHDGLRDVLRARPRTLRAAVGAAIAHQLRWTERHADLARFVYARGHLDWDSPGGSAVAALNRDIAGAFRDWMAPLVERGELRATSALMVSALVGGPAHAIAHRWLAGHIRGPLTAFAEELADAAYAALRGAPVTAPRAPAPVSPRRVKIELLSGDGSVIAGGETALTEPRGKVGN